MVRRRAQKQILERLKIYPAVALVGARQCGKTTLAQSIGGSYFDLEQPPERLRLDLEWDRLEAGKNLVILDEAQSWPDVFARLRGAIDRDRRRAGRFLLLGSVSPSLMTRVSESLAGRLSLVELTPLLLSELESTDQQERRWLCGGFPDGGVLDAARYPLWQRDYLSLLTQRDLPAWGFSAKPQTTDRLLRMLAPLNGQIWNANQVGQSLGLSYHTVNSYLDYLEGPFLVRRLPPFAANLRKRLVKRPKIYWRDTGLLHAIQGVPDQRTLIAQPWVGASWEGFVVEQILSELSLRDRPFSAFFFRTSDRFELDLVLDFSNELWAVEVKLTASPAPEDMARLDKTADMIKASRRFLISQTRRPGGDRGRVSCDLATFMETLRLESGGF
jgi:predicted AAA+ superfamily ATPase